MVIREISDGRWSVVNMFGQFVAIFNTEDEANDYLEMTRY